MMPLLRAGRAGRARTHVDPRSFRLTRRQLEVAALVAEGLTNREIAHRLFISERTAEGHLDEIRSKLGLTSRAQVAAWFSRRPPPAAYGDEAHSPPPPGNLPLELTSFVGRQSELAYLDQLCRTTRLLTLTGPAGCGKTRLALRLAALRPSKMPDGAWLAELAGLTTGESVASAIARAVDVPEAPGLTPNEQLSEALASRRLLLLIDNCEHLIDAVAELVLGLLSSCPALHVLATSREPLEIPGELTWNVPPMSLPNATEPPRLEDASRYEAVLLFADRASARMPEFRLTAGNLKDVSLICQRLDGLPLAIELAAALVPLLPITEIASGLDHRFRLLTRGGRGRPERQRTLDAAIRWSYDLLSAPEQVVFRRLAVFADPFDLDSAAKIAGAAPDSAPALVDLVTSLVSKSLLAAEGGQYRMLDTMREFGLRCLEEAGEVDECYRLLAEHLRGLVDGTSRPPESWPVLLDAQRRNLSTALRWCEANDPELGLLLATEFYEERGVRGHALDARSSLERLLVVVGGNSPLAGRASYLVASFAHRQKHYAETERHLRLALDAAHARGDQHLAARCLDLRGKVALENGDVASALESFTVALQVLRGLEDRYREAELLFALGQAHLTAGEADAGRAEVEASLAILNALGARDEGILQLAILAATDVLQNRLEDAREILRECLAIARRRRDTRCAYALEVAASLAEKKMGSDEASVRLAAAGAAMHAASGNVPARLWRGLVEMAVQPAIDRLQERAHALWAEGAELSFEQAIDLAEQLLEAPRTDSAPI